MPRCTVGRGCHGGDEQDRGVVGTNPAAGQQRGSVAGDGGGEVLFQVVDLVDFQLCAATDEQQGAHPGECFAQLRVGRHEQGFELVDRLGPGLDGRCLGQFEHPQHRAR